LALLVRDDYAEAVDCFVAVIQDDPGSLRARIKLAEAFTALEDHCQAVRVLNEIISLCGDSAEADFARGQIEIGKGQFTPVYYYSRAIAKSPIFPEARLHRAMEYYHQGRYLDALVDVTQCLIQYPDNKQALLERSKIFSKLRRYGDVFEDLMTYTAKQGQLELGVQIQMAGFLSELGA
jgi:tetratricopeptide (TPR) repeat protein